MKRFGKTLAILVFLSLALYLCSISTLGLCSQQSSSSKTRQKTTHRKSHVKSSRSTKAKSGAKQKAHSKSGVSKAPSKSASQTADGAVTITGHATFGVGPNDSTTCSIVSGSDVYGLVMDSVVQSLIKELGVKLKPGDMREVNSTKIRVTGKLTGQSQKHYTLSLNSIAGGTVTEAGTSREIKVSSYKVLQYPSAADRE